MEKKNIKTIFKPYKTLKRIFRIVKDKSDPVLGPGVYQISCSGGKSYIGQAGRSFKSCLKEHVANTTHNHISNSTIIGHSFKSKHLIWFDQTKIMASHPITHLASFKKHWKLRNIPIIVIVMMVTNSTNLGSLPFIS